MHAPARHRRRLPRAWLVTVISVISCSGLAASDRIDDRPPDDDVRQVHPPPDREAVPPDRPSDAPPPVTIESPPENPPEATAAPPPPPAAGLPITLDGEASEELTDALFSERQHLNAVLYRDRRSRIAISRTLSRGTDASTVELLTDLQAVLDAPHDSFAWVNQDTVPRPIRGMIDALLCQQPNAVRASYERRFGVEAAQLLKEARRDDSAAALSGVLRKYRRTRAGLTALAEAAALAQDRGQFAEAARLRAALLRDPLYRRLAPAAGQNVSHDGRLLQAHQTDAHATEGIRQASLNTTPVASSSDVRSQSILQTRSMPEWLYAFGNSSGLGGQSGSPPYPVPVWARSFVGDDSPSAAGESPLADEHAGWVEQRRSSRQPTGVAIYPIVSGETLLYRDYHGVTAVDVTTGRHLWTYTCHHSFAGEVEASGATSTTKASGSNSLRYEHEFAGNSACGVLTADRHHAYTVDWDAAAATRSATSGEPPVHSRLLALPLQTSEGEVQPAWTAGGDTGPLSGHVFLGPPLPVRGSLFCMTEHVGQLHLASLDPEDGSVRWLQPLAIVDRPIHEDEYRRRAVCMPSSDGGVIVCPTLLGAVVGVDAWTGDLLWTRLCVDDAVRSSVGRRPARRITEHADATLPSVPVVQHGRVVYLPPSSDQLFCLDLGSGKPLWDADRDTAHFVATVRNGVVLLVGRRHCIGRALADGRLLWKTKVGHPAGRGVVSDGHYLLPLSDGTLASLRIADGGLSTSLMPSVQRAHSDQPGRIGNLAAIDDGVVSVTPEGVQLFLPSARLQTRLEIEIAADPDDLGLRIQAAEVAMVLGETDTARGHLEAVLASSSDEAARKSVPLLRDLLYYELLAHRGPAAGVLQRLAELADSPREEARLLTVRLRVELGRAHYEAALGTAMRLRQLDYNGLVPLDLYGEHLVAPSAVSTSGLMRMLAGMSRTEQQLYGPRLLAFVGKSDTSVPGRQEQQRTTAISVGATHVTAAGEFHSGGLQEAGRGAAALDLRPHTVGFRPRTGDARTVPVMLAATFGEFGMATAGNQPVAMDERQGWNADSTLTVGAGAVAAFRNGEPWADVEIRQLPIEASPATPQRAGDFLQELRDHRECTPSTRAPYRLFDLGTSQGHKSLLFIDRRTANVLQTVRVPLPSWSGNQSRLRSCGRLLLMSGQQATAVSVDSPEPLWTWQPETDGETHDVRLGPVCESVCVAQSGSVLAALDPQTGRVLWQRFDVDADAGLFANERSGVFGDENLLVVFEADQKSYTLLETATGAVLRQGQLAIGPHDVRRPRRVIGRRLVYATRVENGLRWRVWDPKSDRLELDLSAHPRLLADHTEDGWLACLGTEGRLVIFDLAAGEVHTQLDFSPRAVAQLSSLTLLEDDERFYINLGVNRGYSRCVNMSSDLKWPHHTLSGHLIAVDRQTGARLWDCELENRSVLELGDRGELPFLVTVCAFRDATSRAPTSLLLELIDRRTGDSVASNDSLQRVPIVHVNSDTDHSRIQLIGPAGTIQLEGVAGAGDLLTVADVTAEEAAGQTDLTEDSAE
ncbi:outer membrane biogenesis protein BamB [Maioricimonas rarisocia]|uniref:Outer membrane biogenesis protein BamB n=1 Tax=Maioricimonas rarisocia TaxID=2528026 RepID=A0A517Z270_9PLAN|nr:PQQ-binding-like beta-propeller repeat protein [Maioricimonas rarisocia]QDU36572.1 outer membrane biogenesis protein BamB [Maioricimonas rarisocia]